MSFIASIIAVFASVGVQTARLDALYNDDLVVTNVTESGGVDTNAVIAISASQITNDVASWALKPNPAPVTDLTPAFAYTTAVSNKLETGKQNVIADLETIRSGAALGATAVQTETDPTVSAWAKASQKPSYTYDEIGGTFPGWIKPDQVGLSSDEFWIGQDTNAPYPSGWQSDVRFFHYKRGVFKVGYGPSFRRSLNGRFAEIGCDYELGKAYIASVEKYAEDGSETIWRWVLYLPKESGYIETREHAATNYLALSSTNSFASGILTQSGRDCAGKIADATNAVTKVLKVTQGDEAWEYNGTEAVQIDLAQGGGTDGAAVTNIVASIFPSNRVFGVDGGLLSAYDVSADGARTNEIWREARGYAMTNGITTTSLGLTTIVNPAIDGTITTITIGDATTAAAGVSVDLPSAWDAEARDFAVYVFNSSSTAAPLRLPTNATIYGYYANATNALKKNAVTALYFTEISRNTFLLGRAELTKVQEAAQ